MLLRFRHKALKKKDITKLLCGKTFNELPYASLDFANNYRYKT